MATVMRQGAAGHDSFLLDSETTERHKRERLRSVNTRTIPLHRMVGFSALLTLLALWETLLNADRTWPALFILVSVVSAYVAISTFCLRLWFGSTGNIDLGFVFLNLDLLFFLLIVNHAGPAFWWLGLLLLCRVADQVGFNFRRAFYFVNLTTASVVLLNMVAWSRGAPQPTGAELTFFAVVMYFSGVYIALSSRVNERLREETRAAVRTARESMKAVSERSSQLDKARVDAESASREKSQFLATMSQKLRAPTEQLLDTVAFLRATELTKAQLVQTTIIQESSDTLVKSIDNALDFAFIEAGTLDLNIERIELNALVNEVQSEMVERAFRKNLQLRSEYDPENEVSTHADRHRLKQILLALVDNALRFSEHGTTVIRCLPDRELRLVRLEVSDEGIGLDEDVEGELFETLHPADSANAYHGAGLGLARSKRLADAMHMQLGFHSRADAGGTTFWVEMPLFR